MKLTENLETKLSLLQFECSGRIIDATVTNEFSLSYDGKILINGNRLLPVYNKEHDWFETNVELTSEEKHELSIDMIKMWAEFGNVKVNL